MLFGLTACGRIGDYSGGGSGGPGNGEIKDVHINETVLLDEAGVKITAKKLILTDGEDPQLELLVENNSEKIITATINDLTVNGYMGMCSDGIFLYTEVEPGQEETHTATIFLHDLEICGVTTIADIAMSFVVYSGAYFEKIIDTEMIHLYTSAADTFTDTFVHEGTVLYENDGIKVVATELRHYADDDYSALAIYTENNTDAVVRLIIDELFINGNDTFAWFTGLEVVSGAKSVQELTFDWDVLRENDLSLEDIETITFPLYIHVYEGDLNPTIEVGLCTVNID